MRLVQPSLDTARARVSNTNPRYGRVAEASCLGSGVWGTLENLNGFRLRYCSDVAHRMPTKLCTTFGRLLGWYTIYTHFRGLWLADGILAGAKFTLRPTLAFSHIDSVKLVAH